MKKPNNTIVKRVKQPILLLSIIALLISMGNPVKAATNKNHKSTRTSLSVLPEIIVTAEKMAQPLEKVPASIAIIDGDDIEKTGTSSLTQLDEHVAGFSFQPFGQTGFNAPVMRGLTANMNTFSTSTLLLVDGVPTLMAQGFENGLLDIQRIEILRGPQSTLYGRNAEAGVIAIHSRPMDNNTTARISTIGANHDKRALRFSVSHPLITDQLYASISGNWSKQHGFINNTYRNRKEDDREQRDLNLGIRWTPNEQSDFILRYSYQGYNDGAALWGSPTSPRAQVASGTPSWNKSKGQALSLNASYQFNPQLKLHSITAWNDFKDDMQQDSDFLPQDLRHLRRDNHLEILSQEFRLNGQLGNADWLVGIYGDSNENHLNNSSKRGRSVDILKNNLKGQTLALFNHWNVPLNDLWSVSVGARIENNRQEIKPKDKPQQKKHWHHFSPKLALQYQFTPAQQWYVSVSRGIRSGGFNPLSSALNYPAYEPEKNWSYETGLKGYLFERTIRYTLATYLMNIDDMQVMQMPGPGMTYITNAATAKSRGVELDLDYLITHNWQLKSGLAWNRTTFDKFQDGRNNYSGKQNPFAPQLSGHIGLHYQQDEGWFAQVNFVANSKIYLDSANKYKRNGYGQLNLLAGYQQSDWEAAAYVRNITNQHYDAVGYQNGFVTVYSPPREVGLRLTWRH